MRRPDLLPSNSVKQQILTLRKEVDDLKTAQRVGSTSVTLQRVVTSNAVDFTVTATFNTINYWEITYTPTQPIMAGAGFLWRMFFNGTIVSGTGSQQTFQELNRITASSWVYRFFVIGTTSGQTLTYTVKAVAYAMTQGTISIVQIA